MNNLRAPICGIFGHVDSGKTSFISKLKSFETVEAGGITQGISSIFISIDKIKSLCDKITDLREIYSKNNSNQNFEIKIPGILFIDTPGHEAFANFRSKASDICDLGIIIIDIEKGVENQTLESIKLLQNKKIPFIIILTKLDKLYNWISSDSSNLKQSLKNQSIETINILNSTIEDIKYELDKNDIKSEFYFKNKNPGKNYSIIPVSNKSGEGFNDIVNFLIFITQNFMEKKLTKNYVPKIFVMEKNYDKNLGYTISIILSDGVLNNGDHLALPTCNGIIKSNIRNMIGLNYDSTKNKFIRCYQDNVSASDCITIFAPNLDEVITGTFIHTFSDEQKFMEICNNFKKDDKENIITKIRNQNSDKLGFYLITSTDDEFEAGSEVLNQNNIIITDGYIGNLSMKTIDLFDIYWNNYSKLKNIEELNEYKIILYYTKTEKKVRNYEEIFNYAKSKNISLLFNDVIYKLIDDFNQLKNKIISDRQAQLIKDNKVNMPLEMKLLKQFIFLKGGSSNILCGFKILSGKVSIGTEVYCYTQNQVLLLGKVIKMEKNHKEINEAIKNDEVCIRLENPNQYLINKDINDTYQFYSYITRPKLELLKRDFRTVLNKEDWLLVAKIIKMLNQ